jgi:hypothetical protein
MNKMYAVKGTQPGGVSSHLMVVVFSSKNENKMLF